MNGVLQQSSFVRAQWENNGTRVSTVLDTVADISLMDESVLTSEEVSTLRKTDTKPPQGVSDEVVRFMGTMNKTLKVKLCKITSFTLSKTVLSNTYPVLI